MHTLVTMISGKQVQVEGSAQDFGDLMAEAAATGAHRGPIVLVTEAVTHHQIGINPHNVETVHEVPD